MIDNSEFRKRVILGQMSRPDTLLPFMGGVTALLGAFALSVSGLAVFVGTALTLGSAGLCFTRLVTGGGQLEKQILQEMQDELVAAREGKLDDLERRLSEDGDERTEAALRDLRTLVKAFRDETAWTAHLDTTTVIDLGGKVEQLFEASVQSLEKSLEIHNAASRLGTKAAREPLLARREVQVKSVLDGIRDIGRLLAEIQGLGIESPDNRINEIRGELDASLKVAQRVEERMRKMDKDLGMRE